MNLEEARKIISVNSISYNSYYDICEATSYIISDKNSTIDDLLECAEFKGLPRELSFIEIKKRCENSHFKTLRNANTERAIEWNKGNEAPLSFAVMEFAGEAGEVCNAAKKLARHEMGWVGGSGDLSNLKEELADVIITADLIAKKLNIDLWECVVDKFNKTSEKHGFKTKI
jgi:NTP pyrophosphatase (non-canonical NTP hydrolase)